MSIVLFLTRAASLTTSGLLRMNARSNITILLSFPFVCLFGSIKKALSSTIEGRQRGMRVSRGATYIYCCMHFNSLCVSVHKRPHRGLLTGAGRWRLSRGLLGGFLFCWRLRCTVPQFSVAQQEGSYPILRLCVFVVIRIAVVLAFVNMYFASTVTSQRSFSLRPTPN